MLSFCQSRSEEDALRIAAFISCVALACLLILPSSSLLAQQSNEPEDTKLESPTLAGTLWKSETTGRTYRVRVEAQTLRAEWSNVPTDLSKRGAYIRSEARPAGQRWVGTSRSQLPCAAQTGATASVTNWCLLITRIEFDRVAPTRITGRGETLKRFDCQTCKILETGWANFTWVPQAQNPAPLSPK